jgi:hypothetical protein
MNSVEALMNVVKERDSDLFQTCSQKGRRVRAESFDVAMNDFETAMRMTEERCTVVYQTYFCRGLGNESVR